MRSKLKILLGYISAIPALILVIIGVGYTINQILHELNYSLTVAPKERNVPVTGFCIGKNAVLDSSNGECKDASNNLWPTDAGYISGRPHTIPRADVKIREPQKRPGTQLSNDEPSRSESEKIRSNRIFIDNLPSGNIVLSSPDKMYSDETRAVSAIVGIGVSIEELKASDFDSAHKRQVAAVVKISNEVMVVLEGDQFEIKKMSPEKQSIASGIPSVWRWAITPKKEGRHKLTASMYIIQDAKTKDKMQFIKNYGQEIEVNVRDKTIFEQIKIASDWISSFDGIGKFLGPIVFAVAGYFGLSSFLTKFKKNKNDES